MNAPLTIGLWTVAGLVLLVTAVRSRHHWGEPGAKTFTALTAAIGVAALAFGVRSVEPLAQLVGIPLMYSVVPVLWAIFAFEFTGRYDVSSTRRRLLIAVPAVYEIVGYLAFTLGASIITGRSVTAVDAETWYVVVNSAPGPTQAALLAIYTGQFLGLFYLLGLLLVATAVLVGELVRYDHLGPGVAAWLALGAVGPWIALMTGDTLAASANLDTGSIQLAVAIPFVVASVGMATALERYDLFAAAPAAGTVGPERVLEDLSEPIVVVDHDERVVRLNPAARRAFGTDRTYVGEPVTELLGHDVATLQSAGTLDIDGIDRHHHYEATVSEMTGQNGRSRGYAVVLRDVTGRTLRQQRLQVLNRVLRHNLRNDLTAVRGRAKLLGDEETDETVVRDVIVDKADNLIALSDRAREVEQMLSAPVVENQACDLGTVVSAVVDDLSDEYDVDVSVTVPRGIRVDVDPRVLQPVVYNLVVNAIRHHDRADPTIEVAATVGEGSLPVVLSVVDDGPGLPKEDRAAVERGAENPLEHGSGLGLWAIKWGVTRLGGHLSIRDNEPRGTVVEVRLPAVEAPAAPGERGDAESAAEGSESGESITADSASSPAAGSGRDR